MNQYQETSAGSRRPQVVEQTDNLDIAVESLTCAFVTLADKLSRVTRPHMMTPSPPRDQAPAPVLVPLASTIEGNVQRLTTLHIAVRDLIDNVEV